ncbi:MAG: hypothetical protein LBK56_06380 [Gracilibacteraceae bacterium]|jgi:hypothetical protein|nr:hypothetical protein [Gracilibacteraceae bacterium]
MYEPFYAKSPGNSGYIKNMEVLGFHDLSGVMAFQMALHKAGEKYYMYCGSFRHSGLNIIDVTDPRNPRFVKWLETVRHEDYPNTKSLKVQIADNLLVVGLAGGGPTTLNEVNTALKGQTGVMIYDLSQDPENPLFLSHWDSGVPNSFGVHRFCYRGGRYIHLTCMCKGFCELIYRILDIQDPRHPVEVGRWWLPEQFIGGYFPEKEKKWTHLEYPGTHMIYVEDNIAYVPCNGGGLCLLDISDVTLPQLVGQLKICPPFSGRLAAARCHTALPLKGRPFAVLTNEGQRYQYYNPEIINNVAQPMNGIFIVDVRSVTDPVLVSVFPYPEVPENYPFPDFNVVCGAPGPFGPHNLHEPMGKPGLEDNPNRVYCCYFHAGMRVYDVTNPYNIKEIAYFIPPNPEKMLFPQNLPGNLIAAAEDCVVDDRGIIYMSTLHDGMYILRAVV